MDAACIAWDTSFLLPVLLSPPLSSPSSLPALPFVLRRVLLQLSRCCVLLCLIAPRARVGFLRAPFPDLPPCLSFVLPACCVLPRLFSAFVVFSHCLFWLAVLVPSLLPSRPFLCACVQEAR
jgi:hypothetical protein